MRSVPLFLTAAALGVARAHAESDVTVTVTATRTHSVCPVSNIATCEASGWTDPNSAGLAWASKWNDEKSKYGQWNDWTTTDSETGSATTVGSTTWASGSAASTTGVAGSTTGGSGSWTSGASSSPTSGSSWYSTSGVSSSGYSPSSYSGSPSSYSPSSYSGSPSSYSPSSYSGSSSSYSPSSYSGYGNSTTTGSASTTSGSVTASTTSGSVSTSSTTSGSVTASTTSSSVSTSSTSSLSSTTTSATSSTSSLSSTTTSSTSCPTYTPVFNATYDKCNTGSDRSKWCNSQDISSNSYTNGYKTGITRTYTFTITNTTLEFDGTGPQLALAVNGQVPGPVIEANWGDMVEVTIINEMKDNATTIHFHGIRQLNTNDQDGVPGVTECGIAGNGGSRTYTWLASSYGTSWYHSHAFAQYGDGIRGPIVIHGPATANYDLDMGTVMLDDTFGIPVGTNAARITSFGPGGFINVLFNGMNTNAVGPGGAPFQWTVQPCRKHLFRIINSSSQNMWVVGFDSHNMTVIAADFVPIVPYSTESLNIAIGQRYDVIVEMNQPIGSYYVRAVAQTGCPSGGANTGLGTTNAIMNYVGSNSTPVTNTPITNVTAAGCIDEPLESLVPYVALPAGTSSAFSASASTIPAGLVNTISTADDGVVNKWYINNGYMNVNYSQPTLSTLDDSLNQTLISNPVILSTANTWVYFIIQNQFFASHPMHIHGHDVSVLGTGSSPWDNSLVDTLNFVNPTRRDTVMLQGSTNPANPAGYTVIGFETDNPGAWLMHCHIIWHVDDGLSLQFIERPDDIVSQGYSSKPTYEAECSALEAYAAGNPQSVKTDGESGLKRRTSSPERSTLEKLAARHVKAGDMKRDHLRHGQIRKRFAPHHHAH